MKAPCKIIKYMKRRSDRPVIKPQQKPPKSSADVSESDYNWGGEGDEFSSTPVNESVCEKTEIESLRDWITKQRFIPQDLSDDFLFVFLLTAGYDIDMAAEKMKTYFYSRQEPNPLFRNRDPKSPENINMFKNLYVLPMPSSMDDGRKVILTGLVEPVLQYNQIGHAKLLALVLDLLIWEKDIGSGEFVVIFDGRGFQYPQLLENKVRNHKSITSILTDTIPIELKGFYLIHPPSYVINAAESRSGIWITVVHTTKELLQYLLPEKLPVELGGNNEHLENLIKQWNLHMQACRNFFIQFEKRMIKDYRRRSCHEKEVLEGGKNWVSRMKLEQDEWEYKIKYYEKMKNMKPLRHPGFGSLRVLPAGKPKKSKDFLTRCRKLAQEEEERSLKFEPSEEGLRALRKAQREMQRQPEGRVTMMPVLRIQLPCLISDRMTDFDWDESTIADEKDWDGERSHESGQTESDTELDFHEEIIKFNKWLELEPYLPKNIDEEMIITFLSDAQNVEDAERKFMNYYYRRQSMRSVFMERHPCSPNNLMKYDAVCVVPLTSGLDKKWIIFATWLSHNDPAKFCIYHMTKLIFTELDILLQENQVRGKTVSVILDMKGYSEEHTNKVTRFAAKQISFLFMEAFPAKFNGFYIVNPPEHVADYTTLFGPFDFHIVGYVEDLPGFLPKKFLTSDLGGKRKAPSRDSLFEPFFKRMRRCGNWLAYEEFVRSQELMLRMTTTREEFNLGGNK